MIIKYDTETTILTFENTLSVEECQNEFDKMMRQLTQIRTPIKYDIEINEMRLRRGEYMKIIDKQTGKFVNSTNENHMLYITIDNGQVKITKADISKCDEMHEDVTGKYTIDTGIRSRSEIDERLASYKKYKADVKKDPHIYNETKYLTNQAYIMQLEWVLKEDEQ